MSVSSFRFSSPNPVLHGLRIIAPAFGTARPGEAELLGSTVWLWMHAGARAQTPLAALASCLLPPLRYDQYLLCYEQDGSKPVAYLAWARMSADAERRYLTEPTYRLSPEDWHSGDRMWLIDWFTPFGHALTLRRVTKTLFAGETARLLSHHGHERGQRVIYARGHDLSTTAAREWWRARPMLAAKT